MSYGGIHTNKQAHPPVSVYVSCTVSQTVGVNITVVRTVLVQITEKLLHTLPEVVDK